MDSFWLFLCYCKARLSKVLHFHFSGRQNKNRCKGLKLTSTDFHPTKSWACFLAMAKSMNTKDFRATQLRYLTAATAAVTLAFLFVEMLCYVLGRLHSSCVLCTKIGLLRWELINKTLLNDNFSKIVFFLNLSTLSEKLQQKFRYNFCDSTSAQWSKRVKLIIGDNYQIINYLELLVFPYSFGHFWMPRTFRWPIHCTWVAVQAPKHRPFSTILSILTLF